MTAPGSSVPFALGGLHGLHGGHWNPLAQAQSNPLSQSNSTAYIGAIAAQQAIYANALQALGAVPLGYAPNPTPPAKPIENAGISAAEKFWATNEPMHGNVNSTGGMYGLGIHAFKSQSSVLESYAGIASRWMPILIGTVALWGEVIEHERGYRAEYGKIASLYHVIGVGWWRERRILKRLRWRYKLNGRTVTESGLSASEPLVTQPGGLTR